MRIKLLLVPPAVLLLGAGLGWAAGEKLVEQVGSRFPAASMAVAKGDKVVFANGDDINHNITIIDDDDNTRDLGMQRPGQRLDYLFDRQGRFTVRCSVHPRMKMTINVQ